MELMQTLDDAWNSQDLGTFNQRHKPEVVVRWPGRAPTHGRHDHKAKARALTTLPDQHLDNRPYRVFFASGDRTCSIAHFSGTMTGRCDWQSRFVVPVCALRRPPAGSRRGLPAGSARLSTGVVRPCSTSAHARQPNATVLPMVRTTFQAIQRGSWKAPRTALRSAMPSGSPAALMSSLSGTWTAIVMTNTAR